MHAAGFCPELGILEALVAAGADVNAANNLGQTPLMYAASETTNPAVITFLLGAGADPVARTPDEAFAVDYARDNEALTGTPELEALWNASK
jgi:ankyrin repeat protein